MPDLPSHEAALAARKDLRIFGNNARLLFALESRFRIQDIQTVAANSLTDGPNDKKCDLVYVDRESGYAMVAQGYESGDPTKDKARANKASDLNTAVGWLFSAALGELPEGLRSAAAELRSAVEDGDVRTIQAWYVHNLPESEHVEQELRTVEHSLKAAIRDSFPAADIDEIAAIEVGRATLEDWYLALAAPILVTDCLKVKIPGGYPIEGDGWSAAVTSVPAAWIHELYKQHGVRLFSANVRDYLGSRRSARNVNHNIKATAGEHPGKFWAYNNGITALVNDFDLKSSSLEIEGISIVNGAQTSGAIGSLSVCPDGRAYVQARFVKCGDVDTVQKIIQFNNTQNVVKVTDFRSNDPVQRRLRTEFENVPNAKYLGGRRGGEEDTMRRPGNVLPTDTCSQALAAFHQDASTAYNRKSEIWENDKIYSKYFSEETTAQHIVFVFSLLRAIERHKRELVSLDDLTQQQQQQRNFFHNRGSTFLLASAIASCIEAFLGRAIPNKLRLSFGPVSPETATGYWDPIVQATVPFCTQLDAAIKGGLKNRETIANAIGQFQSMIEATKAANNQTFAEFQPRVLCQ